MNVLVLDEQPETCALLYCDRHVQLACSRLSDLLRVAGDREPRYQSHPWVEWAGATVPNFEWIRGLLFWVTMEYRWRFRRRCDYAERALERLQPRPGAHRSRFEVPPLVVPSEHELGDVVDSYQSYYRTLLHSADTWTNRPRPVPLILEESRHGPRSRLAS